MTNHAEVSGAEVAQNSALSADAQASEQSDAQASVQSNALTDVQSGVQSTTQADGQTGVQLDTLSATGLASDMKASEMKAVSSHMVTEQASTMTPGTFSWEGYFTAIGSLLILLALLWALVWVLRKSGKFNFIPRPGAFPRDGLRIESQLPLGPRKGLVVVRYLDKRLLLGVTEQQITLLQEVEENNDSTDFQSLLEHEQNKNAH